MQFPPCNIASSPVSVSCTFFPGLEPLTANIKNFIVDFWMWISGFVDVNL